VRFLAIGAVALFLGLLAYGLATKSPDDTIDSRLAEGHSAPAPAFSLEPLAAGELPGKMRKKIALAAADGSVSLEELRGTPIVLNFWASWCTPCEAEARVLERVWRRARGDRVLFLGLDIQDLRGDARAFLDKFHITYPSVRDPTKKTLKRYGATAVPETYFIDANGRVVAHVVGTVSKEQLDSGVASALTGRLEGRQRGGARRPPR
jgi:cytochrome c biogenesis protein CcmG/thiol:disulfide interchange protein DsbE